MKTTSKTTFQASPKPLALIDNTGLEINPGQRGQVRRSSMLRRYAFIATSVDSIRVDKKPLTNEKETPGQRINCTAHGLMSHLLWEFFKNDEDNNEDDDDDDDDNNNNNGY